MTVFLRIATLAFVLVSSSAFAANEVVAVMGGSNQLCSAELEQAYREVSGQLRSARATNKDPERIKVLESALEVLIDISEVDAYGMTVAVVTTNNITGKFNLPSIEMNGKSHTLASITSIAPLEALGKTQIQITFNKLGICQFANPHDGSIGATEIQTAVDSILNGNN